MPTGPYWNPIPRDTRGRPKTSDSRIPKSERRKVSEGLDLRPKEPITIVGDINASSTETFEKDFTTDGVLTGLFVATYVGHEHDLRYTFELVRNGTAQNLTDPLDKAYLTGNGENHDIEIRRNFEKEDTLRVTIENNDGTYAYHYNARVAVDYAGWDIGKFIRRLM